MSAAGTAEAAVAATPMLQYRILGPLEVSRDGAVVDLGARKQRAVLAVLLLNANRVVPTERLIDELWGDSPPETARSALQVYVAALRKALGDDGSALRTSAPGYVLDVEPGALDLDRFVALRAESRAAEDDERRSKVLREALALWRDTPLADLAAEPFAAGAVARLDGQRLEALEQRIDADLALGRHASLVPELESLVVERPYRERLRAQLMLALYRSGRQADALDAYRTARRTLDDDLGLEPGPELRELEAAILRHDSRLSLDSAVAAPTDPPRERSVARRPLAVAVTLLVGLAVAASLLWLLFRDGSAPVTVPPGSVAAIDPETNEVAAALPVGGRPGPIADGLGSLWVGNLDDRTLTRIDPREERILGNIALPATPTGVDVGSGAVWVAHGRSGQLSRVDPTFGRVSTTVDLAGRAIDSPTGGVAAGRGWVWVVFGKATLFRVDPSPVRPSGSALTDFGAADVVLGHGSVWVSNAGGASVQRFDPITFEEGPLDELTVGRAPRGIAATGDAVWVAVSAEDVVARIDPGARSFLQIPVGDGPEDVVVGAGAVWVANRLDGTVSRIDPERNEVVARIEVGNAPSGLAFADGKVWLSVQAP
jgi:YVTN family beta-propeller protein